MGAPAVTGSVRVEGEAVPGSDVLLFSPGDCPRLLASAVTDAAGAFTLEPDDDELRPSTVLAKLKGDPIGVLTRDVEPSSMPARVELDAAGPLHSITATIVSDAGYPDELLLALEPVRLQSVPERLRPFVNQRAAGVFDGRFFTRTTSARQVTLRVQAGTWRIGGEFLDHDRPNVVVPDFRNYVVVAARSEPDGTPLPGTPQGGFELDVDADRAVTLVLREVPDEEL